MLAGLQPQAVLQLKERYDLQPSTVRPGDSLAIGNEAEALTRIRIGSLELGDLRRGDARRLDASEVSALWEDSAP